MPAQLLALDSGPSILLDKPILLLGRHPECDIQIDSRKISRRHCCIAQVSDYLVIRDLGSTNGIRINGVRLIEGRLAPGDELTIGNSRYKVMWDAPLAPAAEPVPAPVAKKQTVRAPSSPVAGVEDDLLESCDEPVPLDEPADEAPISPIVAAPPPNALPLAPIAEEPVLLPDEFELLPNSDIFPNISPHESGSHHPT
jgi:predicted component of type VI protein secretion system